MTGRVSGVPGPDPTLRAPDPSVVTVRTAGEGDLPAIEAVQEAAGRGELLAGVRAAVRDPGRLVVVAEAGGGVVGWAKTHVHARPDGAAPAGHYLGGVTVTPTWRRRGVGAALTATRIAWLARRTRQVHYVVNAGNEASIALHRRWGFEEVARSSAWHGVRFAGGVGVLLGADLSAAGGPR